MFRNYFFDF